MNPSITSRRPSFLLLLALLALPVVTASAATVNYTDGSKVNLLNAYNATLALTGTNVAPGSFITPDQARFFSDNTGGKYLTRSAASSPAATLDLGAVRTVKTISVVTLLESPTGYGFTAATVETSNDGSSWTTYTGGMSVTPTTTNAGTNVLTLNSSVNARYVRVTPTTFEADRWIFYTMRAFGDSGALAGDSNLSIIANGGLSAAQTLTPIGTIEDINGSAILTPAANPHALRTVLWNIGTGEGFQLDLGQTFAVDRGTMAVDNLNATLANPITLTLSGSADGSSFDTLYTYTWTSDVNLGFLDMSFTASDARYLNVTFSSNVVGGDQDMRVTDFAFFQTDPVPEPQTWALAALGVSAVLFRLRRKQRVS